MKEILTTILLVVVTNWTEIGVMTNPKGNKFSVLEGKLQTNTVVHIEWSEEIKENDHIRSQDLYLFRGLIKTNEFVLKSVQGQVIGEKLVEITNVYITNIWIGPTNDWWPKYWWQTNKIQFN